MVRFIIISPNPEQIQAEVQSNFPDFNYQIAPGVWAVAASSKTPSEICQMLGIKDSNAGVVFTLDSYYGFYDQTLWEKLNLWEEQ